MVLYGHLDKQPPMEGWRPGLGPWEPVLEGDRLYGRGAADDGYSMFAALTALEAVQAAGGGHARCVLLIEASEESGSPDLPAHLAHLEDRLGSVDLVICLDSGAATYDRLWLTTSLRGVANLTVRVDVLTEGVHSGAAGGVVPSSFRILRLLLDRIEDAVTGELRVPECLVVIPEQRRAEAEATGSLLNDGLQAVFPFAPGVRALGESPAEQLLNRTWRPALEVIAADGLPRIGEGGNVARPFTALQLSLRLPPTVDVSAAIEAVRERLTDQPAPHGAPVQVDVQAAMQGWNAPATEPWLGAALDRASKTAFDQPARATGEGGSIPFMAMLGERFPKAQFVVTGVLGPGSNAHGPNEFLQVDYARRLTEALAILLDEHASNRA
ncbi:MAG: M20/M25/M40 family metallo-hydrolase [Acidimicrobiales bacterium]|nr:M20/M25/M40 family metallo-hydrolase [Acidimicrobiales bacterium]